MFEVGQKVWDVVRGEGVVDAIESETPYPINVKFADGGGDTYMTNGRSHVNNKNRSLYPYPVEVVKKVVKPSINWEHVRDKYKFLAQDANGNAWLYWEKPLMGDGRWLASRGDCSEADSYASYTPGIVDWKHSLIVRPQEV